MLLQHQRKSGNTNINVTAASKKGCTVNDAATLLMWLLVVETASQRQLLRSLKIQSVEVSYMAFCVHQPLHGPCNYCTALAIILKFLLATPTPLQCQRMGNTSKMADHQKKGYNISKRTAHCCNVCNTHKGLQQQKGCTPQRSNANTSAMLAQTCNSCLQSLQYNNRHHCTLRQDD